MLREASMKLFAVFLALTLVAASAAVITVQPTPAVACGGSQGC
jgi:hypothetical protein